MAEQQDDQNSYTLPPPPSMANDSPFEPRTLAEKTEYVENYAWQALMLSIASIFCCGMIGFYAYGLANSITQTIDYYSVAHDKRGLASAAKVISIIGLAIWILALIVRIMTGTVFQ